MATENRKRSLVIPSDTDIIIGLKNHDEEAFRAMIYSCGPQVYGKALQVLHEPRLAEEVAQDTLLVLWWAPTRFDASRGTIRTFLVMIARYKAIDAVRRQETIRSKETVLTQMDSLFAISAADEHVENAMIIRDALSSLPKPKQEVLFLAFYRGLSYREVAQALNIPEGTVKTRIRDSLHRLKVVLASGSAA